CQFWAWCGMYAEARRWLARMLDLANRTASSATDSKVPPQTAPGLLRAQALLLLGILAAFQADYLQACEYLDGSVTIARDLDDSVPLAHALGILGLDLALIGAMDRATTMLEDSLRLSHMLGDAGGAATALRHLGIVARWQAQYERADGLLR